MTDKWDDSEKGCHRVGPCTARPRWGFGNFVKGPIMAGPEKKKGKDLRKMRSHNGRRGR